MLNRAALIVRPQQPFIDWLKRIDGQGPLPGKDEEQVVYLIPDVEDDGHLEKALQRVYAEIFERQLEAWYLDQSLWPQPRTLAVFKKWFKIECHTMIEDLCGYHLEDDEFDRSSV